MPLGWFEVIAQIVLNCRGGGYFEPVLPYPSAKHIFFNWNFMYLSWLNCPTPTLPNRNRLKNLVIIVVIKCLDDIKFTLTIKKRPYARVRYTKLRCPVHYLPWIRALVTKSCTLFTLKQGPGYQTEIPCKLFTL